MILHLTCDKSGSMSEGGKHLIVRSVARAVEQYSRFGYGHAILNLVAWSNEARVVEWNPDEGFPPEMLTCEGAASVKALINLLGEQPKDKVLLVTDGFWALDEVKALKRWRKRLQQDTLRVIKIGADTNPHLKGTDVFAAEDLFVALDGWLEGGVE